MLAAALTVVIAALAVPAEAIPAGPNPAASGISELDGCTKQDAVYRVEAGSTIQVPFTEFPEPTSKPTESPSPPPPPISLPAGASAISGTISFDLGETHYDVTLKPIQPKPPIAATPATVGAAVAAPEPAPSVTPSPIIEAKGPSGQLTSVFLESDIATIQTPSPEPSASGEGASSGKAKAYFVTVQGVKPGLGHLVVSSGPVCAFAYVKVFPVSNITSRLVVSSGIATSVVPVSTYTALPIAGGGINIFNAEQSNSQVFLPILLNYRLTSFPGTLNAYASAGLAASGSGGRQLYGLSAGDGSFFFTLGFHSDEINELENGLKPGSNAKYVPGSPITFQQRTTRPFAALTFPICSILQLVPGVGGCSSNASTGKSDNTSTSSAGSTSALSAAKNAGN